MKQRRKELKDFDLVNGTVGVIIDGVWLKKDGAEVIIRSPFFGEKYLHFRELKKGEKSITPLKTN